jgi:hypothetical protein
MRQREYTGAVGIAGLAPGHSRPIRELCRIGILSPAPTNIDPVPAPRLGGDVAGLTLLPEQISGKRVQPSRKPFRLGARFTRADEVIE